MGIEDVGLSDLFDPKPRRTWHLFAALVNCSHNNSVFKSYREKEQRHFEARATQAKLDACTARVNKMRAWPASTADKRRAMTAELADCSRTFKA